MKNRYRGVCLLISCLCTVGIAEAKPRIRVREVAEADGLLAELRAAQMSAPPARAGNPMTHDIGNVVINPVGIGWPTDLFGNLVQEQAADGSVSWPFTLCEDAVSHDALLLNRDGKVIHVFASESGYDPDWVANFRFHSKNRDEDIGSSSKRGKIIRLF